MTRDEVLAEVDAIRAIRGDDEAAHSAEDKLYVRVLDAISRGADNPAALASTALRTGQIEFERWCA